MGEGRPVAAWGRARGWGAQQVPRPETGPCPADLRAIAEMRQNNGNWILQGLVVHWDRVTLFPSGSGSRGELSADEGHPRRGGQHCHRTLSAAERGLDHRGQGRSREARREAVTAPAASVTELPVRPRHLGFGLPSSWKLPVPSARAERHACMPARCTRQRQAQA